MTCTRWPVEDSGGELDDAWCADEGCWQSAGEAVEKVMEKLAERYRAASRRDRLEELWEEMGLRAVEEP